MWVGESQPAENTTYRNICKYASNAVDYEATEMIRATGALLSFVDQEKIGQQLEHHRCFCVQSVSRVSLEGFMHVDFNTLKSLHVLCEEPHPSQIKGTGHSKEGFSLFGLLNRTLTKHGSHLLKSWLLAPSMCLPTIEERLDTISFLVAPENEGCLETMVGAISP